MNIECLENKKMYGMGAVRSIYLSLFAITLFFGWRNFLFMARTRKIDRHIFFSLAGYTVQGVLYWILLTNIENISSTWKISGESPINELFICIKYLLVFHIAVGIFDLIHRKSRLGIKAFAIKIKNKLVYSMLIIYLSKLVDDRAIYPSTFFFLFYLFLMVEIFLVIDTCKKMSILKSHKISPLEQSTFTKRVEDVFRRMDIPLSQIFTVSGKEPIDNEIYISAYGISTFIVFGEKALNLYKNSPDLELILIHHITEMQKGYTILIGCALAYIKIVLQATFIMYMFGGFLSDITGLLRIFICFIILDEAKKTQAAILSIVTVHMERNIWKSMYNYTVDKNPDQIIPQKYSIRRKIFLDNLDVFSIYPQ